MLACFACSLTPLSKKKTFIKTNRSWTPDDLFGSVLSCDRDNKDLALLHPVRYGDSGAFAVSLWVKAAKESGQKKKKAESDTALFQYALSHGAGASPDSASASDPFAAPGVHVLLPRGGHGASGLVRAVVKDSDDVPGRSFLDSDGRVNDDADRAALSPPPTSSAQPRTKADDGGWHHVVVSTRPEGGDGFLLYVDGRLRGEVPAPPGAAPAGETLFADGGGSLKASGLSNSSIYLCGRSDGAADRFFSGSVAHVGIWDSAIDAAGASALFESVPVASSSSGAAAKAAAEAAAASAASTSTTFKDVPEDDSTGPAVAAASDDSSSTSAAAPVSLLASSPSAAPRRPVLTVSGTPCSFPFNYGGRERWECVPSAADNGASSFCQDAAGHLSRCAAVDSAAELEEKFGALRSYLDQYVAAPGGALVVGPDGKVALCSRHRSGGTSGDGKKTAAKTDDTTQLLLPAECPGVGDGASVCARLTKSQVARLGPFPSDEARDAFAAGDAGVCARPQGSLLPAEAGDPRVAEEETTTMPSSTSAAAAAKAAASAAVPLPSAYFPLSNYSAAAWPVPELALRNLTLTNTTTWVEDSTFGSALECSRADSTNGAVSSSKDAAALLPNVPLGPGGAFAVNLWMRQYSSPGKEGEIWFSFFSFFKRFFPLSLLTSKFKIQKKKTFLSSGAGLQYLFSARASGLDHRQPLDDPAFFMPGQAHIFLPGDEHPGGRRLVRAIVKDTTDSYAGRHSRTFLDSDGVVGSDAPRATPRPALADGEWHMVTLTTLPEGGKGFELYVDGTRRGKKVLKSFEEFFFFFRIRVVFFSRARVEVGFFSFFERTTSTHSFSSFSFLFFFFFQPKQDPCATPLTTGTSTEVRKRKGGFGFVLFLSLFFQTFVDAAERRRKKKTNSFSLFETTPKTQNPPPRRPPRPLGRRRRPLRPLRPLRLPLLRRPRRPARALRRGPQPRRRRVPLEGRRGKREDGPPLSSEGWHLRLRGRGGGGDGSGRETGQGGGREGRGARRDASESQERRFWKREQRPQRCRGRCCRCCRSDAGVERRGLDCRARAEAAPCRSRRRRRRQARPRGQARPRRALLRRQAPGRVRARRRAREAAKGEEGHRLGQGRRRGGRRGLCRRRGARRRRRLRLPLEEEPLGGLEEGDARRQGRGRELQSPAARLACRRRCPRGGDDGREGQGPSQEPLC